MHAAPLTSPRLQRVLRLLEGGQPRSTREIVVKARVMAVNACISELRQHGAEILCTRRHDPHSGRRHFLYTMTKAPKS
jgi:hypothetical protein